MARMRQATIGDTVAAVCVKRGMGKLTIHALAGRRQQPAWTDAWGRFVPDDPAKRASRNENFAWPTREWPLVWDES